MENVSALDMEDAASVTPLTGGVKVIAGANVEMPVINNVKKPAPRRKKSKGRA
jgi:hypothetical protein